LLQLVIAERIERAARAGAADVERVSAHDTPWGPHRQGGFTDTFGHRLVSGRPDPTATGSQVVVVVSLPSGRGLQRDGMTIGPTSAAPALRHNFTIKPNSRRSK